MPKESFELRVDIRLTRCVDHESGKQDRSSMESTLTGVDFNSQVRAYETFEAIEKITNTLMRLA